MIGLHYMWTLLAKFKKALTHSLAPRLAQAFQGVFLGVLPICQFRALQRENRGEEQRKGAASRAAGERSSGGEGE
jgi:hypothetical protein